ncbi:MAG: hypothetical protein BJ554DRAFT_5407, partial [Olpidium bornovanus]
SARHPLPPPPPVSAPRARVQTRPNLALRRFLSACYFADLPLLRNVFRTSAAAVLLHVTPRHLKTGGMSVILLDTEVGGGRQGWGCGAESAGRNHDVKIFALALLLASTFVYNSMGSIDEGALDRLSYPAFFCSFLRFFRDKKRKKRPVDPRHSRARLSPARPHPRDLIPAPPSLP